MSTVPAPAEGPTTSDRRRHRLCDRSPRTSVPSALVTGSAKLLPQSLRVEDAEECRTGASRRPDVPTFQTRLWLSGLLPGESLQQGALANARAAVARDRVAAAQRGEAQAALEHPAAAAADARRAAERGKATRAS
jgi:hypothetical protein